MTPENSLRSLALPDLGHDALITALAMEPSGARLATGDAQGVVKVWALPSGRLLHTIHRRIDRAHVLACAPKHPDSVKATDELLREFRKLGLGIDALHFRGDGLVVVDGLAGVGVYQEGRLGWRLNQCSPRQLKLGLGGQWLWYRSLRDVRVLEIGSRRQGQPEDVRTRWTLAGGHAWRPSPKGLEAFRLPDFEPLPPIAELRGRPMISGDGQRAVVREGKELVVWDLDARTLLRRMPWPQRSFMKLKGRHLVSRDREERPTIWDIETGKLIGRLERGASVELLALSADGQRVAVADAQRVHVLQASAGPPPIDAPLGVLRAVNVSSNGRVLVTDRSGRMELRAGPSGRVLCRLRTEGLPKPAGVALSPEASWAATWSKSPGRVDLHDLERCTARSLELGRGALVFADEATLVVVGARQITHWATQTGARVREPELPRPGRWGSARTTDERAQRVALPAGKGIRVVDTRSGETLAEGALAKPGIALPLALHRDRLAVLKVPLDEGRPELVVWAVGTSRIRARVPVAGPVDTWDARAGRLALVDGDAQPPQILVIDLERGRLALKHRLAEGTVITALRLGHDGRSLLAATGAGDLLSLEVGR